MSKEDIITYDDIMEFINEFKLDSMCPQCHVTNWSLEGATKDDKKQENVELLISSLMATSSTTLSANHTIPCYALLCYNCGYVKMYAKYAIKLWKAKKLPRNSK